MAVFIGAVADKCWCAALSRSLGVGWLPAAAECAIKLNQRDRLIQPRLSERVFSREQEQLLLQHFIITRIPYPIAFHRDFDCFPIRLYRLGLQFPGFGEFFTRDQSRWKLPGARSQLGCVITQRGFLPRRAGLIVKRSELSAVKNWSGQAGRDAPR